MKKVIYIAYAHLSQKVVRDQYMDYLRAEGIEVEYWDLVSLLFGGSGEANMIERDYVFTPNTYDELDKMLGAPGNRDAIYIILIVYEGRFVRLFRLLNKYKCKTFFILWGQFPCRTTSRWLNKVVGGIFRPIRLGKETLNRIKGIACKKLKLVNPFDVVFAAGYAPMTLYHDAGKVVPINSIEYDDYIRSLSINERLVEGGYAVFLDIYLPYQKNNLKLNHLGAIDPHDYFSACNRFFDLVERKFGVKVVIAAHPRSDYENNTFGGREIYRGMTPKLVKDSDFVISHNSTSLSYAVLNMKPIIFIFTNEMKRLYKNTPTMILIHEIASYLGSNVYNIDEIIDGGHIAMSRISPERYENYKYGYLTTLESEHTTTQEIFRREINA
jgi:hypothetical protein